MITLCVVSVSVVTGLRLVCRVESPRVECLQLDGLLQDCLELINTLAVDYFSITKPIPF